MREPCVLVHHRIQFNLSVNQSLNPSCSYIKCKCAIFSLIFQIKALKLWSRQPFVKYVYSTKLCLEGSSLKRTASSYNEKQRLALKMKEVLTLAGIWSVWIRCFSMAHQSLNAPTEFTYLAILFIRGAVWTVQARSRMNDVLEKENIMNAK